MSQPDPTEREMVRRTVDQARNIWAAVSWARQSGRDLLDCKWVMHFETWMAMRRVLSGESGWGLVSTGLVERGFMGLPVDLSTGVEPWRIQLVVTDGSS